MAVASPAQAVWFEDVTAEAGIDFQGAGEVHPESYGESTLWPAFPELVGSGACFADFDGDGYDDLYLVSQAFNPENLAVVDWGHVPDARNALYINNGDATFRDASLESGTDSAAHGNGCSAADFDGDGDMDLFVTNYGPNELYLNNGHASFTEIGEAAGVRMEGACGRWLCWSTSSAWADYDQDGDLDLYVGNFVNSNYTDVRVGPQEHTAQHNHLFQNQGDGTFAEVAVPAGVAGQESDFEGTKTLAVAWLDADLDGDLDLYAANDGVPNDYYVNQGDGSFVERSTWSGLDDPRASMGIAVGDYDQDGYPDIFIPHYGQEHSGFYRNLGNGQFEDRSGEDGLSAEYEYVGWGTRFTDLDRDGDLDLMSANGFATPHLPPGQAYGQPTGVYLNEPEASPQGAGDRLWTEWTANAGPGVATVSVSRGMAFSDFDLDGDTDAVVTNNANQSAQLLQASGVGGNWLLVELDAGEGLNRHGIGSRVTAVFDGRSQVMWVEAGSSFLSQNSLRLDFGLGEATAADIAIVWPDGTSTDIAEVAANQAVRIDRAGQVIKDVLGPVAQLVSSGSPGRFGWWTSPVTVSADAVDRGVTEISGVDRVEVDRGSGWEALDGSLVISDGHHELAVRAIDRAGNAGPLDRGFVRIDARAPDLSWTTAGPQGTNGWFVGAVEIAAYAADSGSGLAALEASVDGDPWTPLTGNLVVSGDGVHTVLLRATDIAGNQAISPAIEVPIDATPPITQWLQPRHGHVYVGNAEIGPFGGSRARLFALPGAGTLHAPDFAVTVRATDDTSGVDSVVFRVDRHVLGTGERSGDRFAIAWPLERHLWGDHALRAYVVDQAGNEAVGGVPVTIVAATERGVEHNAQAASSQGSGWGLPLPLGILGIGLLTRRRP